MRLTCAAQAGAFIGALTAGPAIGREILDLQVQLHEGTNGTMLGRCDRTELHWPSGPWDSEPDVIVWQFRDLLPILCRDIDGRWMVKIFGTMTDKPGSEIKLWSVPEVAEMTGINKDRLGRSFLDLEEVGLEGYVAERGIEPSKQCLQVLPGKHSRAPSEQDFEHYVTAADALGEAGRVLKVLNLDPVLHNGTDYAWTFDNAQQVNALSPGKRFGRLDVQDVIASDFIDPIGPRGEHWMAMKTWGKEFLLLRHQPGYGSSNTDMVDFMFATEDLLQTLDTIGCKWPVAEQFRDKCEDYIRACGLLPIAPIGEIDRLMNDELASLAKELR